MNEIDSMTESMKKSAVERGFNLETYLRAIEEQDETGITLLHPWNFLTEKEVYEIEKEVIQYED